MKRRSRILIVILLVGSFSFAQSDTSTIDSSWALLGRPKKCNFRMPSQAGWFSLGGRSTLSTFSGDGTGLGTGGQFRVQLNNHVNTDWFADYIVINQNNVVRSTYYHIGWSVMYYPMGQRLPFKSIQPYILAGHCFDYNKKTLIEIPNVSAGRWGSAVQAGIGTHYLLSQRMDFSLTAQYMVHLTEELEIKSINNVHVATNSGNAFEGHLLLTLSINYRLFKIWEG